MTEFFLSQFFTFTFAVGIIASLITRSKIIFLILILCTYFPENFHNIDSIEFWEVNNDFSKILWWLFLRGNIISLIYGLFFGILIINIRKNKYIKSLKNKKENSENLDFNQSEVKEKNTESINNPSKNSISTLIKNLLTNIQAIFSQQFEMKDIFWIGPIIIMIIGILPWPIGYYTLLRIIVCGGSVYFAFQFYKQEEVKNTWIFGFFAILYNPFLPIHLQVKILWTVINIITIFFFYINRKNI